MPRLRRPVRHPRIRPPLTPRWRVRPASEPGAVRVEIDTGRGLRAATVAEIDQALRQLHLFGAADADSGEAAVPRATDTD